MANNKEELRSQLNKLIDEMEGVHGRRGYYVGDEYQRGQTLLSEYSKLEQLPKSERYQTSEYINGKMVGPGEISPGGYETTQIFIENINVDTVQSMDELMAEINEYVEQQRSMEGSSAE